MTDGFINYISQFLPLAAGIGIMICLRSVRHARRRICIDTHAGGPEGMVRSCRQMGMSANAATPERQDFSRFVKDNLIINGRTGDFSGSGLDRAAFSCLGVIDENDLHSLRRYLRTSKMGSISLFIRAKTDLGGYISGFNAEAGLLLAFLTDARLRLVGENDELA